jgi:hypothetical protein
MLRGLPVDLTLTSEYRGYRWRSLTKGISLHDMEGFFPATTEAALRPVSAADAKSECRRKARQHPCGASTLLRWIPHERPSDSD